MTDRLDFINIGLHAVIGAGVGLACGAAWTLGWPFNLLAGFAMIFGAGLWPIRELSQHNGEFRFHWYSQSMWEFIAPVATTILAYVGAIVVFAH